MFRPDVPWRDQAVFKTREKHEGFLHQNIFAHPVQISELARPAHKGLGIRGIGVGNGIKFPERRLERLDDLGLMDNLCSGLSEDMSPDQASPAVQKKLGNPRICAVHHGSTHVCIVKSENFQFVTVFSPGFFFRHPEISNLGFRKYDIYIIAVINAPLDRKCRIGACDHTLVLGRRGKLIRTDDVPACIDVSCRCPQCLVGNYTPRG